MNRSSFFSLIVSGACLVAVASGCQPRGESRTIDEIFADARSSYQSVSNSDVSGDVAQTLKGLTADLDKLAGLSGKGDGRALALGVSNTLVELVQKAGIPSRPAMTELINQYRNLSAADGSEPALGAANLKLLAARTYSLIKSELGASKFKL